MLICILNNIVITSCSVTMMLFLHLEVKPLMTLTTVLYLSCALISELSRQMTTSTTSIDIMGLQAAYANLHTDQERDYFMQRYHDVITDRKSGSAGMPRPISYAVFCLKKKKEHRPVHPVIDRGALLLSARPRARRPA